VNNKWYTYLALVFAIWFALSSWIWVYLFNVFFSYPFGAVAILLYFFEKKRNPGNYLNKWVLIILIAGWLSSLVVMLLLVK
jgi:hypothetical protein